MNDQASKKAGRVLVSDFDGTMTRRDFFQLVVERLLPPECPDYWGEYLAGRLTHFEALKAIFGSVTAGEAALLDVVASMELEPDLKGEIEVHANPGRIEAGRLVMELPEDSPFLCRQTGVDKVAIVRAALREAGTVAYAGDGLPDLAPALVVPAEFRFARGVLAEELTRRGERFRPFEHWGEVARALLRVE
jgi:2-hydroxy-3-keto-5-methylthiopentenyl-1-phosphate phosphatase